MNRSLLFLAACDILLCGVGQAAAGFIVVTDPTKFAYNDTAPWDRNIFLGYPYSYPTMSGMGTFSWGFTAHSTPDNGGDDVVQTMFPPGSLFVGEAAYEAGGTGSYVVNANVEEPFPVIGFGFTLQTGYTLLTVYDAQGDVQTLPISTGLNEGFVGIESNVPLTGFQFSNSVTSVGGGLITTTLFVDPVEIDPVPVPDPPGLILMLAGVLCIGGYAWRRRKLAAA